MLDKVTLEPNSIFGDWFVALANPWPEQARPKSEDHLGSYGVRLHSLILVSQIVVCGVGKSHKQA
jgi:hypothetical protein